MASQIVEVVSGFTASSGFVLDPSQHALVVHVPSYGTASLFQVQFTTASGAAATTYGPLGRPGADGFVAAVWSINPGGPIWGVVEYPPTPFARLFISPAATIQLSCTVAPARRS